MDISRLSGRSYGAVRNATKGCVMSNHATTDEIRRIRELKSAGWINKHIAQEVGRTVRCVERHTKGLTKISLTDDVKERMRRLKRDGFTAAQIAEHFGFAESTVHGVTRGIRKNMRKGSAVKGAKLTEEIVREVIVPWFREGLSAPEISRRLLDVFKIKVDRSVINRIRNRKAWAATTKGLIFIGKEKPKMRKVS